MDDKLLDDRFLAKLDINSLDDIKKGLTQAGIQKFYEHKNGSIIVEEGDAVRVAIFFKGGKVYLKPKFPQIGNSTQIVCSALLLAIFLFIIPVPFPFQWVIAIGGGQLISYLIFMPKTKKLREKIEDFL